MSSESSESKDDFRRRLALFLDAWRDAFPDNRSIDIAEANAVVLTLESIGNLSRNAEHSHDYSDHLRAVLSHSTTDEDLFDRLWEQIVARKFDDPDKSGARSLPEEVKGREGKGRKKKAGIWQWLVLFASLLLVAWFLLWKFSVSQPVEQPVELPPEKEEEKREVTPPESEPGLAPIQARELEIEEAFVLPANRVDFGQAPETVPFIEEIPWWKTLAMTRTVSEWVGLALGLLGFAGCLHLLWKRAWLRDQANFLTREMGIPGGHGRSEEFFLELNREVWNPAPFLSGVVSRFRRHKPVTTSRLDSPATIRLSIRKGGQFFPVYEARPETPQYLFLVGERHQHDHMGRLMRQWIKGLRSHGVSVDEFRFTGSPAMVYPAPGDEEMIQSDWVPRFRPLRDLSVRYANHRVVIFGMDFRESHFDFSREAPWITLLNQWEAER